jgi:seryl-tRNA synthetase
MAVWQDIWQLGQKVLALTKTTETNTSEIKKLQEQQLKLTKEVIRLKQELELERQKNLHQKELYQSEINRYKAELDNKLKELEILLLRAKIDAQTPTPDKNQSNYLESGKDEDE